MSDTASAPVEGATVTLSEALAESLSESATESPVVEGMVSEPVEGGEQAEGLGDADETPSEPVPEPAKFYWQINGQDVEVTEDEARNGYLRQADYTRKTQELAQQREQLRNAEILFEALQNDPQGALEALRQELLGDDPDAPPNPYDAKLAEIESFIEQQREREAEAAVNAELAAVKAQFGEFNEEELLGYAIERQIPNLRDAWVLRDAENRRVAEERARTAAKRTAPPVAGGSRAAGTVVAPPLSEKPSLQDAFSAALQELTLR